MEKFIKISILTAIIIAAITVVYGVIGSVYNFPPGILREIFQILVSSTFVVGGISLILWVIGEIKEN
jgi:K+ transporter